MNDSAMFVILSLVVVTIIGTILLSIILWVRKLQSAGGVQGLQQKLQQELKDSTPAYPDVTPAPPSGTALGCSVVTVLWMVAAIAIGIVWQLAEVHQVRQLQTEGVFVTAWVSKKEIVSGEDDESYYIHYTFSATMDTDNYTRRESVPEYFYDRTEQGAPIEIVYVPSAPGISRLREFYTPGKVRYLGVFIGAGTFLPGLMLGLGQFRRYRNARRLDDEGVPVTTRVVEHHTYKDSDGDEQHSIIYELPSVGRVRQSVTRDVQQRHPVESTVRLLYLPDNPLIFRMEEE